MYHHYHIDKKELPLGPNPVGKMLVTRSAACMNCGRCTLACVYKVHERSPVDPRVMWEPHSHLCKNCLKCVENCPQRALEVRISPVYSNLGEGIWTPTRVTTMWNESQTGKLPVFGAGYRGMFVGPGYDSMWTDMSEIVRPTRDGIHGREYISTTVDLGARVDHLEFGPSGQLLTAMPPIVQVPLPILMDVSRLTDLGTKALEGLIKAASTLGTFLFIPAEAKLPAGLGEAEGCLAPVFSSGKTAAPTVAAPKIVEFEMSPRWKEDLAALRSRFPGAVIAVRVPVSKGIEELAVDLVSGGVDVLHLLYDEQGKEQGTDRLARDSLLAINKALAQKSLREAVSILAAGGLAAAEHVPKSIICGADAVVLERALKVALGCHANASCPVCPMTDDKIDREFAYWRTINMIGAWRDQLLEVMGAMGVREARRLRGEIGRAIFYEDAERDAFANIQGGA
ncbi:MAG: glutamate synthase-related protein [Methanomassiliicoccus sp.]|nr:glutamate synthase-related protein [Methanomassiliicoccus sp.]